MSLAQGNNTPTKPRIELSKVYMLKTCLEIITEKGRGMKLFSWIHMFLTLFPSHAQASALFEKWLKIFKLILSHIITSDAWHHWFTLYCFRHGQKQTISHVITSFCCHGNCDRRFIILKEIGNRQINLIGDNFPLGFK